VGVSWKHLLLPLTPLYAGVVGARTGLYRLGWLRSQRLGVPVVSVGNLSFGGTGKTPTVIALVRDLVGRGRRPAVLTRGYGRHASAPQLVLGPDPGVGPDRAGDEPLEMAARLPGVPIVVDANRVRSGHEAQRMGADVVVMDDGFQHLRLRRDLDLVLIDAGDPWGGGRLPPLGRLREPRAALRRATAVVVTKLPEDYSATLERITAEIRAVAGELPVLGGRMVAARVRQASDTVSPDRLRGRRVLAMAGLGRPENFVELLEEVGAEVVATRWYGDHHRYTAGELDHVLEEARVRDATVVTTAKDAVKLPADAPLWIVEAELVLVAGSWDELWRLLPEVSA
jgi:tetraacyldisaccharide 4'-kinase